MDKRFNGRVAVVTGGGSGIGLAVAERFAGAGAAVAILERDPDSAARAAGLLRSEGGRCEHFVCDVSCEQDVARTAEAVSQWAGSVHHLVNNAGIILVKPLDQITAEEWDCVMDVNVKGTFLTAKHFLALLRRESAPTIVNLGSVSSFVAQKHISAYVASKGAVAMLSKAMALDFAEYGIRVNCVCPGITDTPMLRYHASQAPDPEAVLEQRRRRVPLGRLLLPGDIADAVVYLSGPESAGVTGTTLLVDGGLLAAAEWD